MTEQILPLSIHVQDGITVVRFRERFLLDAGLIQQIEKELSRLIVQQTEPKLVIDFSGVQVLASRMLSALVAVHEQIDGPAGALVLCNLSEQVERIMTSTRITKIFVICSRLDEAIQNLQNSQP